nr:LCP family protein [bacterium]
MKRQEQREKRANSHMSFKNKFIAWLTTFVVVGVGLGVWTGLQAEGIIDPVFRKLQHSVITTPEPDVPEFDEHGNQIDPSQTPGEDVTNLPTFEPDDDNTTGDVYVFNGEKYRMKKNLVSIVLTGVDTAEWRDVNLYGFQSDVMVLAVINTKDGSVRFVSLPRDTYAKIPLLDAKGNVKGYRWGKLNSAYSQGGNGQKYSYENMLRAISMLFGGVSMPYYIGINMDSVGPLVDCVGGVTLVSEQNLPEYGVVKGETVTLKGEAALKYVRNRKQYGADGSDIGRVKRQMNFIKAFANQCKSAGFVNLITNVLPAMTKYVKYNMTINELVAIATKVQNFDFNNVDMQMLPGAGYKNEYWKVDEAKFQELLLDLYFEKV